MNFLEIEKLAQEIWKKDEIFSLDEKSDKQKFYVLAMFPYPSGDGLHLGHTKGYFATDIVARYKTLKGFNVLHPMGWDAFGLPAENYAIKVGKSPKDAVAKNISNFKKQMDDLGLAYDWTREINTTEPVYYKWTQWIFLKLFKAGLAYEAQMPINFCPSCKTGLANEEVVGGACERCGTSVVRKQMRQWVLKITEYADKLLKDIDKLNWPKPIKEMQTNWIGRSEGSKISFKIVDSDEAIEVFTTRADTLFGATYIVLAPEHSLVEKITTDENKQQIEDYLEKISAKSDLDRTDLAKEKTGVFTGSYAINPINDRKIQIWISDYVLANYGTGALMAVPAHDKRDFEFAKKFDLPIETVVVPDIVYHKTPPIKGKKWVERTAVESIIYDPKRDKYLCLRWKSQPWIAFITGGVEDGESFLEAAKREILEETGLKNINFVKELGETNVKFYAAHKDINRLAHCHGMFFELVNEEKDSISQEESERYDQIWLSKDELTDQKLTCASLRYWHSAIAQKQEAFEEYGNLINSEEFSFLNSTEAKKKITQKLIGLKSGDFSINYKLRDWIFSRQRYWGEPIPIIHCEKCGPMAVDEKDLPVTLPELENFEPTGTGESPLARVDNWVNTTCPKCASKAKRETNTMPQWAGSCWYYLRYIDPKNDTNAWGKELEEKFMPVDLYVGGAEHAVLHLLYARFWHKFLYDQGLVTTSEPFSKLQNVGLILGPDRQKMSKSRGNVINPTDLHKKFGVDALRLYEMFVGPFDQSAAWSPTGISGTKKFIDKVIDSFGKQIESENGKYSQSLNTLGAKITSRIENMQFNTAVSDFMSFAGEIDLSKLSKKQWTIFLTILSPFAPHTCEYLYQKLSPGQSIFKSSWPKIEKIENEISSYVVQVNAKKRALVEVPSNLDEKDTIEYIKKDKNVAKYFNDKSIKKTIFIEGKLVNFLV